MWSSEDQILFFESILFEQLGRETQVIETRLVSGGSINTAVRLLTDEGTFFVKFNYAERDDQFEKEVFGLELLRNTETVALPEIIGYGKKGDKAYLIEAFIESEPPQPQFWEQFAHSLAQLHSHTQRQFGLSTNNYIGSLPQDNELTTNGVDFFIERRLRPQAGMALYNELIDAKLYQKLEQFYEKLPALIPKERPALLHGDLWSGNFLTNEQGLATVVDPAVYYGFREAELAFTHLFGGFPNDFHEAYHEIFPLEPDFDDRIPIYNLYPLLVHVNLVGRSYLPSIERLLKRHL